ncbi:MAG: alpha/beta fold hydrolase [Actinomycetota bacterium]
MVPTPEMIPVRDGTRLAVLHWSKPGTDGAPVVLVHGLASTARLWDGAARSLRERGHGVVAVDLRGHGLSDKPDTGYSVADVADDVADILAALARDGWTRPLGCGQSWGGNIVVELAARHGAAVRGVVAGDGGTIELSRAFPEWEDCESALAPPRLEGMRFDRLRSLIAASHPDWSDEAVDGQMHNMERLDDGTIRPRLERHRHMAILRGLWEHSPGSLWSSIDVPVLFAPAVRDDAHSRAKREQIADALATLGRADVAWFEGADHDLHAQHPHRFADVVDAHLRTGIFA